MRWTRRELQERFGIEEGERVLDVGCGSSPFPLATHLCDLSYGDAAGRLLGPMAADDRPFFECTVESLPLRDRAFDFVYCAHVLEHVADPAAACRELARVGRRGYVECPASWHEVVFHSPEHRWLVDHERGGLVFREMLAEEKADVLGVQFEILALLENRAFQDHWERASVRRARLAQVYWEGELRCTVIPAGERHGGGAFRWFDPAPAADLPARYSRRTHTVQIVRAMRTHVRAGDAD